MWKNYHAVTFIDTEVDDSLSPSKHTTENLKQNKKKITGSVSAYLTFTSHFNNTEK